MLASRLPLALGWGGLLSLSMFWVLWNMINAPIEIGKRVVAQSIEFSRLLVDTDVAKKRDDKVTHDPPVLLPKVPDVTITTTGVKHNLPHTMPIVKIPGPGPRIPGGSDHDVVPFVRIDPKYPASAARRGIEGWVKVQFSVTATGMVKDVTIVDSEPNGVFDKETIDAVRRWRYSPKIEQGTAVERVGLQTIVVFQLPPN